MVPVEREGRMSVYAVLLRDTPQTIGDIAAMTNLPRRAVEAAIQELRLEGRPVAADGRGVWLATEWRDMERTFLSLRSRAASQYRTVAAVRRCYREMRAMGEQTTLWEAA